MEPEGNFVFILGAQKCGTTTLAHLMAQHPDICMSVPKEPLFMTHEYHMGTQWYNDTYWPHFAGEKWTCEGRVQNLMVEFVTARIWDTRPDPKFIVIVRDPIQRAYSAWRHFHTMRPGREPGNFDVVMAENINSFRMPIYEREADYLPFTDPRGGCYEHTYLEMSMYFDHIDRFSQIFGDESILLLFLEDMARDKEATYLAVCDFLEIDRAPISDWQNKRVGPRPTTTLDLHDMFPTTFRRLRDIFQQSVTKLSEYSGRDLAEEWGY